MYTTIPSFTITLIIFLILGFQTEVNSSQNIDEILSALSSSFNITPWLFLVPIAVIFLIVKRFLDSIIIGRDFTWWYFYYYFSTSTILEITNSKLI